MKSSFELIHLQSRKNGYVPRLVKKLGFKLAKLLFVRKHPNWLAINVFFDTADALLALETKSTMSESFGKVTNN